MHLLLIQAAASSARGTWSGGGQMAEAQEDQTQQDELAKSEKHFVLVASSFLLLVAMAST